MAADKKVFDVAVAPPKKTVSSEVSNSKKVPTSDAVVTSSHASAPIMDSNLTVKSTSDGSVPVTVRREKTISPSTQTSDPTDQEGEVTNQTAGQPQEATIQNTTADPQPPSAESLPSTNLPQPNTVESQPEPSKQVVDDRQFPPGEGQQVPKIFDTTQYQLPIQQRKKGGVVRFMVQFLVVCAILAILASLLAIDAGWLEKGVNLPFDFL